jgi:hypothetical protein
MPKGTGIAGFQILAKAHLTKKEVSPVTGVKGLGVGM